MAGEGAGKSAATGGSAGKGAMRGGFLGREWEQRPRQLPPAPNFRRTFPAPSPAIFWISPFLHSVAGRLVRNNRLKRVCVCVLRIRKNMCRDECY